MSSQVYARKTTYPAFQLLYEIAESGFNPNSYTYSSSIRSLCMERMLGTAVDVFRVMEESGYQPDVDNVNALVLGLPFMQISQNRLVCGSVRNN